MTQPVKPLEWVRRWPDHAFVVFTFAWSWTWFVLALLSFRNIVATPIGWLPLLMIGAPGPTIAALIVTYLLGGWEETKVLLGRFVRVRVSPIWYLVALAGPSLLLVLSIPGAAAIGVDLGPIDLARWPALVTTVALALPFGPLNEELGWRGFWQPRLAAHRTLGSSSMRLGSVWLAWHAPLFWLPGGAMISGSSVHALHVAWYLGYLIGWAAVFGFLAKRTGNSVPIAILLHASLNARAPLALFPTSQWPEQRTVVFVSIIPLAMVAIALMWWERRRGLPHLTGPNDTTF